MDQIRLLAAIGLSFLVLFIWSMFFSYNSEIDSNKIETLSTENNINEIEKKNKENKTIDTYIPSIKKNKTNITYEPREILIETPLFVAIISEKGGMIKSFILKQYMDKVGFNSQPKELIKDEDYCGNISSYLYSDKYKKIEEAIFLADIKNNYLDVSEDKKTVKFIFSNEKGLNFIKTFKFYPDSYLIDVKITLQNISDKIINDSLILSLKDKKDLKNSYTFKGPSALLNKKLKQVKTKKNEKTERYDGNIEWIAIEDRYFMSAIIPFSDIENWIEIRQTNNFIENKISSKQFQLHPNNQISFESSFFIGPKSIKVLKLIGNNLDKAVNFGFFDFIAKPCLWFMNKIYSFIPNYGVSIILLTLSTKLILWPLASKGYKSMSEMKKLQPLITEIRLRHTNDKQKMNHEIMSLYKTYKVNPMGGCLPMILQIPVFFALYKMLYQAIELRHTPFVFWINDLSSPDRLFNFNFSVPFMHPPYGIPVLTIIMGATMLLQQKMSPPPGDPTQAKMMMLIPIIFTFVFINFSSGLVLYWLINNLLSIGQQYYIQKKN